jgi:hypothetical protein
VVNMRIRIEFSSCAVPSREPRASSFARKSMESVFAGEPPKPGRSYATRLVSRNRSANCA